MKPDTRTLDLLLLIGSLLAFSFFWYWARHVYIPANLAEVRARELPVGNNSDLYPRWLGSRELWLHGRDPYSPEVTREIQTGFYGRPLDAARKNDPHDREAFAYPLWVAFFLAPTLKLSFSTAVVLVRWVLIGCIGFGSLLWLYSLGATFRPVAASGLVFLVFASLPTLVEYYQQNLAALAVLLLAGSAACIKRRWLTLGGFLLALATFKPDTCGLLIAWFLVWSAAKWPRRQRFLWSFAATLALLFGASEIVQPGWFAAFVRGIREYSLYATTLNLLQSVLSPLIGAVFSVLLLLFLFALWFRCRHADFDSSQFRWASAWTCIVTLAIIPKMAAYNQLLLLPPLLVLATEHVHARKSGIVARAFGMAPFACLFLHWLMAAGLSLASWFGQRTFSLSTAELPDHIFLAVAPLTLLAVVTFTATVRLSPNLPISSGAR